MTILRCRHFCPIPSDESSPLALSHCFLRSLHGFQTRSKRWKPHVIPVPRRKFGFRDASRRKTHGTDPNAFASASCAPKSHDTDGHVIFQQCAVAPAIIFLVLSCPQSAPAYGAMVSASEQGARGLSGSWFPERLPNRDPVRADGFQMPSALSAPPQVPL